MKIVAEYSRFPMRFRFEAGTSRGVLREKDTFLLKVFFEHDPSVFGVGECAVLPGLSPDDRPGFEAHLAQICNRINKYPFEFNQKWSDPAFITSIYSSALVPEEFPAVRFGFEMALLDLLNGGQRIIFPGQLHNRKIPINGLIWMGSREAMLHQIEQKLSDGYTCIKMKVGALDWEQEFELIRWMRQHFSAKELTIRVDANGAFTADKVHGYLNHLAEQEVESIEQPIKPKQWEALAQICASCPIAVALDEELIGLHELEDKVDLLEIVKPQAIILKPTLLGGFQATREWIDLAQRRSIKWWLTSALESNIGLNAIAQFALNYPLRVPQGLGTGQVFVQNIDSPWEAKSGFLSWNPEKKWEL